MSAATKTPPVKALDARAIARLSSDINIALIDAEVMHSSILDLMERFEYRDRDKETIRSLYTFAKFLGSTIETIKESNTEIEELATSNTGAA
jgi:signal recognition particle GTPase